MIERLEVTPGPGTVIRYGSLAAWAAPSASPGLISFLAVSARNLAGSAAGGQQLCDHLAGVLAERDPEPHAPFAVIGPSEDGWVALLHGQVQVWDGSRWLTPEPAPGWTRSRVWPRPSFAVTAAGDPAPAVAPDSLWDLEAGVVPGGGFVLLPAVAFGTAPEPDVAAPVGRDEPTRMLREEPVPVPVPTEDPGVAPAAISGREEPGDGVTPTPGATTPGAATAAAGPPGTATAPLPGGPEGFEGGPEREPGPTPGTAGAAGIGPEESGEAPSPPAGEGDRSLDLRADRSLDLRADAVRNRVVAYPPLPAGGTPGRPAPSAPVVAGVVCRQGHLNRPGMAVCVRCGIPITGQEVYNVTGTRPALGCLVIDDGSVYRLDSGYLAGSDPTRDPTVRGGLARPLVLAGEQVAPSHAEIRLHDWDVVLTDRDSPAGTFVYGPESSAWERLRAYEPRVLQPGTHIAVGQRVATFLSPWLTGSRPPSAAGGKAAADPAAS